MAGNKRPPPPKGDIYYGDRAQRYVKRRLKQPWWKIEQAAMQDLLTRLPKGLKVVDIPYGTGRFSEMFDARDHTIFGLDSSTDMLQASKTANGDELFAKTTLEVGFSNKLPFEDAMFDLLVSVRFLSDIVVKKVALETLKEFRRVTDGHAIIQLGYQVEGGIDVPDTEVMSQRMSEADTKQILHDHGFEVIEQVRVWDSEDKTAAVDMFLCKTV